MASGRPDLPYLQRIATSTTRWFRERLSEWHMADLTQLLRELEQVLRTQLPPDQHARIPIVLALLGQVAEARVPITAVEPQLTADPDLVRMLQTIDALSDTQAGVNLSNAQVGDVSIRDVARSIIHNTIILSTDPAHAAAHFADGIAAMQGITQRNPAARDALIVFRDRLAGARKQVSELINLKLLHDLLHGLQHRSLPMLVRELRRFPADEEAIGGIEQCTIDLRDVCRQIDELTERATFEPADVEWRTVLPQIADEICAGLTAIDPNRIDRATRHVKSVINTRLSRINTNLVQKARSLQVADLMAPLRHLHEQLSMLEIGAAELGRVDAGITGLDQLHQLLTAMVFVHNTWQELDDELNRIEPTLRSDSSELAYSWPLLRPQIERTAQGDAAWASEIHSAIEQLTQALAEQVELKVRRAFDRLQNRVSHRFFSIDLELKALCDRLRDFRDPLDTLGVVI
jgi:hypothetical protein